MGDFGVRMCCVVSPSRPQLLCQCQQTPSHSGATDGAVKQAHRMQRHKGSFWLEISLESPKIIWAELPTAIRKCLCFKADCFSPSGAGAGPRAICRHAEECSLSPLAPCTQLQHCPASLEPVCVCDPLKRGNYFESFVFSPHLFSDFTDFSCI